MTSRPLPCEQPLNQFMSCYRCRFRSAANLVLLIATGQLFAVERQVLVGHVPRAVIRSAVSQQRLTPGTQLQLAIGLPFRNQELLSRLLADLYDPTSAQYHQF